MRKYRAPYGDGFYSIEYTNGKYIGRIYEDAFDKEPDILIESDYGELCERLANIYF